MPRLTLALLAALLPLGGCTFDGRTDGGSAMHADNGALAGHRDAVDAAASPEAIDPLGSAPPEAPVPTPRLGTVANDGSTVSPDMSPTEAALTPGGSTPGEATGAEGR